MKRILIVRQDKLGDVLLSTPVLEAIAQTLPDAKLTVWTQPGGRAAMAGHPRLFKLEDTERKPHPSQYFRIARRMRRMKFDAALILKPDSAGHTISSWIARIPVRAGASHKYYRRLLTHNLNDQLEGHHEVERNLMIAEVALGIELPRQPLWAPNALPDRDPEITPPYAIIHPATGGTSNNWLPERYEQVARWIESEYNLQVVVTGMPADAPIATQIAGKSGLVRAGKTDYRQFVSLVRGAEFVLSGNSASAHVASACQRPLVVVEMTPPAQYRIERWGPWMTPNETVVTTKVCDCCTATECHRGGTACNEDITVENVCAAIRRLTAHR